MDLLRHLFTSDDGLNVMLNVMNVALVFLDATDFLRLEMANLLMNNRLELVCVLLSVAIRHKVARIMFRVPRKMSTTENSVHPEIFGNSSVWQATITLHARCVRASRTLWTNRVCPSSRLGASRVRLTCVLSSRACPSRFRVSCRLCSAIAPPTNVDFWLLSV